VDGVVVSLENAMTRYWHSRELYVRNGNSYASIAPYDSFKASDGFCIIACGNQILFEKLCKNVAKHPEWFSDDRFSTGELRVANMDLLKVEIETWTKSYTVNEIVDTCLAAGVPSGPIFDLSQIVQDDHIANAREMFPIVDHPVMGAVHVTGDAVKLMETMPHVTCPAPLLGQHNKEIYTQLLGLSENEIDAYTASGIF
jgi:formyl-CoA transferase